MATWTRAQIEVMALAAGWGARATDVSYIAMAESSGDDKVVNSIGATGLLQILQPVHVKDHPTWTKKWLQNPMNNLSAGLTLYKAAGEKFDGPWLDSRDKGAGGGWGQHVKGSGTGGTGKVEPALDIPTVPVPGLGGVGEGLEGTFQLATLGIRAGTWISNPTNWVRIAYVVGGIAMTIAGLQLMVRAPVLKTVKQFAGGAASAAPGGGTMKGLGKAAATKIKASAKAPAATGGTS